MNILLAQMWPTDVESWVGLALSIGGVIAAAVALGWRITKQAIANAMDKQDRERAGMKKDTDALVARVSSNEEAIRKNKADVAAQDRRLIDIEHRQMILERDLSRMIGEISQLTASVDRGTLQLTSAEHGIDRRLIKIEENLKVAQAIESMGENLARTGTEIAGAIMSDVRDRESRARLKRGDS